MFVHHKFVHSEGSDEFAHLAHIQKVLPEGGPTLTTFFFLVDEGREDPNTTISRPTSARQQTVVPLMAQH